jgi:hypothetical protein
MPLPGTNQDCFVEWLDAFNVETTSSGFGPTIHLVPLPTSSQFLDVIEAVFSGMKKAVIHHSDYQSEDEMKKAIFAGALRIITEVTVPLDEVS